MSQQSVSEQLSKLTLADLRALNQSIQEHYAAIADGDPNSPDSTPEMQAARERDLNRYVELKVLVERELYARVVRFLEELDN
ncbi:MAG: hypothetical protein M3384_09560 [Acidobacteriota bacterium]|nr:hypothetical protein [Acidobacteriota bacterium]